MNKCAIGNNIVEHLRRNHMNQRQLAEKINVTEMTMSRWCAGTRQPSVYALKRMSLVFNCTMEDLTYGLLEEHEYDNSKESILTEFQKNVG